MINTRTETPLDMLETISVEIVENISLLEFIFKKCAEKPEKDNAIACLLRSLYQTRDKANSYISELNKFSISYRNPSESTLGERLHARRATFGLSLTDIAQSLGVKPKAVGMWELNKSSPTCRQLITLADVLDCDPIWLLYGPESGDAQ